jgi:hypothetical protein
MPGHWLLAQLGKRVLRPGGLELTRVMLERLNIQARDAVVEFAPGLGATARMALSRQPANYTAVERDETAAAEVRRLLAGPQQHCQLGRAEQTGLPNQSATAPLHLLEPRRVVQDEGFFRALRFVFNVIRNPEARQRVCSMRRMQEESHPRIRVALENAVAAVPIREIELAVHVEHVGLARAGDIRAERITAYVRVKAVRARESLGRQAPNEVDQERARQPVCGSGPAHAPAAPNNAGRSRLAMRVRRLA